jgi:hypothetical protein
MQPAQYVSSSSAQHPGRDARSRMHCITERNASAKGHADKSVHFVNVDNNWL